MPVKQEQKLSCLQSQKYSKYTQYLNQKTNTYNKIDQQSYSKECGPKICRAHIFLMFTKGKYV